MKVIVFEWTVAIEMPDFDRGDHNSYEAALSQAWANVQKKDGYVVDIIDKEPE